ncbi:hypothetical protein HMPREF1547_03196 [Blautia sp. KLE 1732]|nr:hypothetical protein HMPREF1547_03196 [Blautia sp. KLE 1732]
MDGNTTKTAFLRQEGNPCFSIYIRWRERYNHKAKRINREIMKTAGERNYPTEVRRI